MFAWLHSHECYSWDGRDQKSWTLVSMCLYLGKDRQAVRVLCCKSGGCLISWVCGNWKHNFKVYSCWMPQMEGGCASLQASLREEKSDKLGVCRQWVLCAGTLLHYVGEEQVNILWAAATPTPYLHASLHTTHTSTRKTRHLEENTYTKMN